MAPYPAQCFLCGFVVGQQVEGGAGEKDRPVPPRQIQLLHLLPVDSDGEVPLRGDAFEAVEHVLGGVHAVDVSARRHQIQQRITVTATQFQRGLARLLDELQALPDIGDG